jgi:hypothetical protein
MSLKDILFFTLVSLMVGLAANHYFNLNIGFLDNIENSLVSSGQSGTTYTRGVGGMEYAGKQSNSTECLQLKRSNTDRKTLALMDLGAAKKEGDSAKLRETEAKLAELARMERAVCK